jgi:hypothetical protein
MASGAPTPATTFRNIALFFLAVAAAGILLPLPGDLRFLLGAFGIMIALWAGWNWLVAPRPLAHEAPDVIGERVGRYYERDGVCFAPRLEVIDGLCWFHVYVQNRYATPATGTAYFIPMEGTSKNGPHDVPPVTVDIRCDGGEAARVSVPYPLGKAWQGRIMVYDVLAVTKYPNGHGDPVRTPQGVPVGEPTSDLAEALKTVGLLAVGFVRISKPTTSFETPLPRDVVDHVPPGVAPRREVLWQLDLPTGGFPVTPAGPPRVRQQVTSAFEPKTEED